MNTQRMTSGEICVYSHANLLIPLCKSLWHSKKNTKKLSTFILFSAYLSLTLQTNNKKTKNYVRN